MEESTPEEEPTSGESTTVGELLVSKSPDRSNPAALGDTAHSGDVYVFAEVTEASDVDAVEFELDGDRVQTENNAPYDLAGGNTDLAHPLDTRDLSDGGHLIVAHVQREDGSTDRITGQLAVDNGDSASSSRTEEPTSEPSSEPTEEQTQEPTDEKTEEPTDEPSSQPSPSDGQWPDESNTGVVGAGLSYSQLTPSGSITVTQPGTVIDKMDVRGQIKVRAENVTIRRTRVRTSGTLYGIEITPGIKGTVIEDVEVAGTDSSCGIGIAHNRYVARRVNVHGCADGLRIGQDTSIEDSYIHSLRDGDGTHNDAVQSIGGSRMRIVGNRLEGPWREQTSAIILSSYNSPIHDLLVQDNLVSGGTYTVYLFHAGESVSNVRFIDNVWVDNSWKYGPEGVKSELVDEWTNNRTDTGRRVDY